MKKTVLVAALAIATAGLAGVQAVGPYDWRTATEAQLREVFSAMLAQTNQADWLAVSCASLTNASWASIMFREDMDGLRLESDAAFADRGFSMWWQYPHSWPRMSAATQARLGLDKLMPTCWSLCAKYDVNFNPSSLRRAGATVDELVVCLGEVVSASSAVPFSRIGFVDAFKKEIQQTAVKGIRKALRRQGKSFVTKGGVNPVEQYMTALTAALNAPRFAGLNEWCAGLGLECRADFSALPGEAAVDKLRRDILDGEVDMTAQRSLILYVCLGSDGYNAFVKEYNGDK